MAEAPQHWEWRYLAQSNPASLLRTMLTNTQVNNLVHDQNSWFFLPSTFLDPVYQTVNVLIFKKIKWVSKQYFPALKLSLVSSSSPIMFSYHSEGRRHPYNTTRSGRGISTTVPSEGSFRGSPGFYLHTTVERRREPQHGGRYQHAPHASSGALGTTASSRPSLLQLFLPTYEVLN